MPAVQLSAASPRLSFSISQLIAVIGQHDRMESNGPLVLGQFCVRAHVCSVLQLQQQQLQRR